MFVYRGAIYLRKFTKLLPLVLGRFGLKMFKVNFHINHQCNLRMNHATCIVLTNAHVFKNVVFFMGLTL